MFHAYENAKEVIRNLPPIVEALKRRSADLADQIERAGTSMVLNIAEGNRRTGKDRGRFFTMAHGSAAEIRAVLEVAEMWGWGLDTRTIAPLLDRELGLLYGLTRPRSSRATTPP